MPPPARLLERNRGRQSTNKRIKRKKVPFSVVESAFSAACELSEISEITSSSRLPYTPAEFVEFVEFVGNEPLPLLEFGAGFRCSCAPAMLRVTAGSLFGIKPGAYAITSKLASIFQSPYLKLDGMSDLHRNVSTWAVH
jgi:hypothetical protein